MSCRRLSVLLFGLALAAAGWGLHPVASGETLYKWVDEKGVTHYSESPPPQKRSKPIDIQTAPASSDKKVDAPPRKSWQQQELEFQERQKERDAALLREEMRTLAEKVAKAEIIRRCFESKARLAYLQRQRRGPAATQNEKGEIEWWNFEKRGIEINEIGKFIDQNCPPD